MATYKEDHTVLRTTHTCVHRWVEPCLSLLPAAEHHHTLAGTHFPPHWR